MSTRAPSCGNYDWAKLKLQYTNLQTNVGHGQCYTATPKTNVGHVKVLYSNTKNKCRSWTVLYRYANTNVGHGQCYTATPKTNVGHGQC